MNEKWEAGNFRGLLRSCAEVLPWKLHRKSVMAQIWAELHCLHCWTDSDVWERESTLPVSKQCASTTAGLQTFMSSGLKSMLFTKPEIDKPLSIHLLILVHLWFMFSRFVLYSGGQWISDYFFWKTKTMVFIFLANAQNLQKYVCDFWFRELRGED